MQQQQQPQQEQHVQQQLSMHLSSVSLSLHNDETAFRFLSTKPNWKFEPALPYCKNWTPKTNAVKIFSYTFRYSFHLPLFSLKNIYKKPPLNYRFKNKTIDKTTNKKTKPINHDMNIKKNTTKICVKRATCCTAPLESFYQDILLRNYYVELCAPPHPTPPTTSHTNQIANVNVWYVKWLNNQTLN